MRRLNKLKINLIENVKSRSKKKKQETHFRLWMLWTYGVRRNSRKITIIVFREKRANWKLKKTKSTQYWQHSVFIVGQASLTQLPCHLIILPYVNHGKFDSVNDLAQILIFICVIHKIKSLYNITFNLLKFRSFPCHYNNVLFINFIFNYLKLSLIH